MSELGDAATRQQATVFRVGHQPDPFAWTPWEYADDGHFNGRWDDPRGRFRTLYVADTLLGCLLEVLAPFRPDLQLLAELDNIDDTDPVGAPPTAPPGQVPRHWINHRIAGSAQLSGAFLDVRDPNTISIIRRQHAATANALGLADLDAAALKLSAPRTLTQTIAVDLYTTAPAVNGVCFASRHGDTLNMWAIFEQDGEDTTGTGTLTNRQTLPLQHTTPVLTKAFMIHNLVWT